MDYRRYENTIVVRMDRGEEVLETLKAIALREKIRLASISALGAADHVIAGVYSVPKQAYFKNEFNGVFEITNITGNINTMNGEFYSHLHITCADEDGKCFGGHLNEACISGTCEMFIYLLDGTVDREKDPVTGLNVFSF